MNQTFKEDQERIVTYQNNRLLTDSMIKYLHSHVRFYIENVSTKYSLNIDLSSKRSIRSTTNSNILRLLCEIAKNETKNKRWKNTKRIYKIRADNACYLTLLDKKFRKKNTFDYHLTDKYESRIAEFKVWFTHEMIIAAQKDKKMRTIHRKHDKWKTNVMRTYFRECEVYVLERRNWEFNAMLQTWEKSRIFWSITISSFDTLVKLASTKTNFDNENYIIMIKKENRSRIATNTYSNENESEIFANSSSESESSMSDSEEEFSAIASEDEILNQRHMMTKALSAENNSSEQMTFNAHVIALLISRILNSSQQLIAKNSTSTHHVENITTLSEKSYENVEKWMSFDN